MKFHIATDGRPAPCHAVTRACPLGATATHFDSAEEASLYAMQQAADSEAEEFAAGPSLLDRLRETPAELLAYVLTGEECDGLLSSLEYVEPELYRDWLGVVEKDFSWAQRMRFYSDAERLEVFQLTSELDPDGLTLPHFVERCPYESQLELNQSLYDPLCDYAEAHLNRNIDEAHELYPEALLPEDAPFAYSHAEDLLGTADAEEDSVHDLYLYWRDHEAKDRDSSARDFLDHVHRLGADGEDELAARHAAHRSGVDR